MNGYVRPVSTTEKMLNAAAIITSTAKTDLERLPYIVAQFETIMRKYLREMGYETDMQKIARCAIDLQLERDALNLLKGQVGKLEASGFDVDEWDDRFVEIESRVKLYEMELEARITGNDAMLAAVNQAWDELYQIGEDAIARDEQAMYDDLRHGG